LISLEVAFAVRPSVSNAFDSSVLTLRARTGRLGRVWLKKPCGSRIRAWAPADPDFAVDWVGPLAADRSTPIFQVGR
jgi:hypothetical protein